MYYYAVDRWNNGSPYLEHAKHKYIKKIQIGPYTRYFYTLDAVKAYYDSLNKNYNKNSEEFINITDRKIFSEKARNRDYMSKGIKKLTNLFTSASKQGYEKVNRKRLNKAQDELNQYRWGPKEETSGGYHHTGEYKQDNERKSKKDTGKFFIKNLLGFSSKKEAKNTYKKSVGNNIKKHDSYLGNKVPSLWKKEVATTSGEASITHKIRKRKGKPLYIGLDKRYY